MQTHLNDFHFCFDFSSLNKRHSFLFSIIICIFLFILLYLILDCINIIIIKLQGIDFLLSILSQ